LRIEFSLNVYRARTCVSPSRFVMAQECVTRNSFEILQRDKRRTKRDILRIRIRVSEAWIRTCARLWQVLSGDCLAAVFPIGHVHRRVPTVASIVLTLMSTANSKIKILLIAAAMLGAAGGSSRAAAPPPASLRGVHPEDMNRQVQACTDFYEFANGTWRAENPIPAALPRWSRRVAAHEANWHRQESVLDEISRKGDWPKGSVEQVLGDHYGSCVNEAAVDAAGVTPLAALVFEIDAVRNPAAVQRIIRRLHELAVAAPFGVTGDIDYQDSRKFVAHIVAGGLGLPDRDYYLKDDARFIDARTRYRTHVAKILALSGVGLSQAEQAASDIVALEKRLAESALDSATAADPAATDHTMSFAQLQKLTPHIDWERYFEEAKLPRGNVSVAEPKFMEQLDQELTHAPVETWKAYLKWQLLDSASPYLSRAFAEESFSFRDEYLGKAAEMKSRAQRCVESTEALFGDGLGQKYVQAYFPPDSKAKATRIVRNLQTVLKDQIAAVTWMEPVTKAKALEKLSATDIQIGYPDHWKDYSGLDIRKDAFWANVAAGRKFGVEENRRQIGKPTDRAFWRLSPSSPDSYIILEINSMVLTAGTLQPPFFDPDATDAVNYGAMGIAIAHDLTHAIDATGAAVDIQGRPKNWWTEKDRKEFESRSQCLVDQFDGYFIEPGVHHDGKRIRDETVADLRGVRIAYQALQRSMQTQPVPTLDGFTPEQQFFISWGQVSGHAMRLEAQRQLIKSDPHPVPKFRVIGPFSNTPEFKKAFSCPAGAAMVRPAEKRCVIW
jgi:endothelin-converting enzyme/putative endopeptidase